MSSGSVIAAGIAVKSFLHRIDGVGDVARAEVRPPVIRG
jgi:hypothetical protein